MGDANYHGVGRTRDKYAMYITGGYPFVTSTEARYQIIGELYAVDDDILDILDKMEGHPLFYTRREIVIDVEGAEFTAWMYFRDPQGRVMPTGDYNDAMRKDV